MDSHKIRSFVQGRRFGTEFELISFDNRDFKEHPLKDGESPEGIKYIGALISETTKQSTQVTKWGINHNNEGWVIKPDSSCGIEICTPILKGTCGLQNVVNVVTSMSKDRKCRVDSRCGLHVHVNVSDLTNKQISNVLNQWVKAEMLFLDSTPLSRKRNKYCQQISFSNIFETDSVFTDKTVISKFGAYKYYTLNCHHLLKQARRTIEFRIIEGDGCLNPQLVKNWIRLLLHFVESTKDREIIPYVSNDPYSGYCWLDLKELFNVLGFFDPLSSSLEETRNWFLSRLYYNTNVDTNGIWSNRAREMTFRQTVELMDKFNITPEKAKELLIFNNSSAIFN